jgi:hypothetical protein
MTNRRTPDDDTNAAGGRETGDRRVGRRSYLKLAGVTIGSVPLLANAAGAMSTEHDSFARSVDAVEAGCDPSGEQPSDRAFERAIGEDTLLLFPSGTYRFERPHAVLGIDRLGFVGQEASFVVPAGFNANLLTVAGGTTASFRGIDIDMQAPDATPGLRLCARERLLVEDVTFRGRGHPGADGPVANALSPVVRSPEGIGRIRNVVARNDGPIGPSYRREQGRAGVRIGGATRGTIAIEDCRFEGFQNGGAYVSETSGTITVRGGVYRDNDIAGIRIGGSNAESSVRNARVEVGTGTEAAMDACGIRLTGGGSGAAISGCTVTLGRNAGGDGGVVAEHDYGGFEISDTPIRAANAGVPAVMGLTPYGGRYSPPQGSLGSRIERCTLSGSGSPPIRLTDRPAPEVVDSVVDGAPIDDR